MKSRFLLFLGITVLIFSVSLNVALLTHHIPSSTQVSINEKITKYPFLSKRIIQEEQNDLLINFLNLRKQLRAFVEPFGESFSFYFEYLPTGSSLGVNEKLEFKSASLIKLPIVMAYYNHEERAGLESDPVVTIEPRHIDVGFGDLGKNGLGKTIRLSDAIRLMLTESDNTAGKIVTDYVTREDFEDVYEGVDIDLQKQDNQTILTTKQYASILKALYFSSVLNEDHSQKILKLLTETKFNDKLPAGVPSGIPAAHKIGILKNELFQDCGIIYVPKRPYLLCMISQSPEDEARRRMVEVSHMIYTYVSQANP